MRIKRINGGKKPPDQDGIDKTKKSEPTFTKNPGRDARWTRFSNDGPLAAPGFRASKAPVEGKLVAPGVRMSDAPQASRAERRRQRREERTVPTGVTDVPPSRPARSDLIPGSGSAVAPRRLEGLEGPALIEAIRSGGQMTRQLGYRPAREAMFRVIDNVNGIVEGVYTGRKVRTEGIPSANGDDGMNTEHAWPQSKGVRGTPARYDLHHLFPTNAYANGRRGNFPFGVVAGGLRWEENGSKLGRDSSGRIVFEPREGTRGDIARALFYISTVYGLELPQHEEDVLREWHAAEPPDPAEIARNDEISRYQGNRNPFVDEPGLVDKIARFSG